MKDDNCYIVDNTGAVLAIMTSDVTVSILKQMAVAEENKEKCKTVLDDTTENIDINLFGNLKLTQDGELIYSSWEYYAAGILNLIFENANDEKYKKEKS